MYEHPQHTTERAILVGVYEKDEDAIAIEDSLAELSRLVETLGGKAMAEVVQLRDGVDPKYYLGKGKLDDVLAAIKAYDANYVVFDGQLAPSQDRNLEKALDCPVLDRTELILEIFSRHARTAMAKTQVEIANLEFSLTRLHRAWTHLSRQRGGVGTKGKGVGEKQIELDRRQIRDRIAFLKRDLEALDKVACSKRSGREGLPKVALVGYTNAGKSTLLNTLTNSEVLVMDKLFATLDATVRAMEFKDKPTILLTDTVGFIKKLPHSLVASFKSTLDEVRDADLLLHVLDVSHPAFPAQCEATEAVLAEIDALEKPTLVVANKADLLANRDVVHFLERRHHKFLVTSSATGEGIAELKTAIHDYFDAFLVPVSLLLPYGKLSLLDELHRNTSAVKTAYLDHGVEVSFRARPWEAERYQERAAALEQA